MAVSPDTGRPGPRKPFGGLLGSVSRYDLLLAVLPLGFLLAGLVYLVFAVPFEVVIAAAAVFGLAVTIDALFVHPPSEPPRSMQ
jgi:hypothetical protein